VQTRDGVTPPFMRGRDIVRVGLLLPFSLRPQDAAALYNAAELALFDHGNQNTLLIPRDAGATEASASAAAQALVNDGADIIIGPVLRDGVVGAANAARAQNIPVIGFSSDRTVGGNGAYLLSFQLEDEIARIVSYAAERNVRSIALLAPANDYGRRVESALRAEAATRGVTIVAAQLYSRTDADASAAATALAASLRTAPAQGILIAESGGPLRSIGAALVRGGVDQRQVRFMGTSVWAGDAQREPTLAGGWYVAPDPTARSDFETRYQATFGEAPTRLSSLGYDAVALSALLSRDRGARGLSRSALENSEGFAGSDGLFRFLSNGAIERGLAIIEVRPTEVTVLDPAPRRFPQSGS
jgi:ABC-type branched-subunit amino acid transport system substrate-binding protein